MDKIKRPRGLIRFASLNGIERGERLRITPRLIGYTVVLSALITLWLVLVFTRSDVEATMLRAPGSMFQTMPDGHLSNLYTVKVVNKTSRQIPIEFKLENVKGDLQVMGGNVVVAPQQLAENSILIDLDPALVKGGHVSLIVGVYAAGKKVETIKTGFIGPRDDTTTK
jgi:polyferredoxin